jgi:tRNA(Ile)-lysidine synthase
MNKTVFHARLQETLRQRKLLPSHRSILVAVSGGQDSLCLIKLLLDLQPKWSWQIAIAHCDHRWSTDEGIAERVRDVARMFDLPFHLITATSAIPETEAAAREWRYQSLVDLATNTNISYIVTGHTKSDRAETLLYNLIRGSGTDGLRALSWQRYLTSEIQLIRPLLNFSRAETLEFCQQFDLPIWADAVNSNLKYARNRIRNELIPYLQTHFNPQIENSLAQNLEILQAEVEYLENAAQQLLEAAIVEDKIALNRQILKDRPLALQRRVVKKFLAQNLPKSPTFAEIEAVRRLINAPNRSRTSSLPGKKILEVMDIYIVLVVE